MLLDGVHIPVTTPFYPDGGVYHRKLEHNMRRYSLTPVHGLVLLGDAGESAALTSDERLAVLRTASETAAAEKVLIATVSEAGVLPAVQLADDAAALRYDSLLLQPSFGNEFAWWREDAPTPELLTWFRSIADRVSLPVILSSRAARRDLPVSVLAELAEHPNVIGVLEQSLHIGRVADLRRATEHIQRTSTTTITFTAATQRMLTPTLTDLPGASGAFVSAESLAGGAALAVAPTPPAVRTRTKQTGIQILWAHAHDATAALRAGAAGMLPAVAAAVPQAVFEIWAAWKDGDESLMAEKQRRVASAEPFFLQEQVAAVKAGAELSGYFGGRPRLPLLGLQSSKLDTLEKLLDGMRS